MTPSPLKLGLYTPMIDIGSALFASQVSLLKMDRPHPIPDITFTRLSSTSIFLGGKRESRVLKIGALK